MTCRRCEAAGPLGPNYLHTRECAFKSEVFSNDNWNCETMIELRNYAENAEVVRYSSDQNLATIPLGEGRFMLIGWYKRRGRTEYGVIFDESETGSLCRDEAEAFLLLIARLQNGSDEE